MIEILKKKKEVVNDNDNLIDVSLQHRETADTTKADFLENTEVSLITKNDTSIVQSDLNNLESNDLYFTKKIKYIEFFKKLSIIAFPTMLFYLFSHLMQTINLIFIRIKYNNDEMSQAIGASNLYMNCTLFAVVFGFIIGIDTLCSNAYSVKKYYLMGLYYHRARIVTYIVASVIVILHIFTAHYMIGFFNLKKSVLDDALKYLYYSLIYVFFEVQSILNLRFMNVLRKSHVSLICLLICIFFHPLWNYIFLIWLDLGIMGSAICYIAGRFLLCFTTTLYLWIFKPLPEASFWINKKCFMGIWSYWKYAAANAVLVCAEWWPFEILAYMSTYMTEIDYNIHIYIQQLYSLFSSSSIGISFAVTVYVSDYIAKSSVRLTKRIAFISFIFSIITGAFLNLVLFCIKGCILKIFTTNEQLLNKGEPAVLLLSFTVFFRNVQYSLLSVLRGLSRQSSASILTVFQYYLVMITLAYVFGIQLKMGVSGFWLSILIGNFFAMLLYLLMLTCIINWEKVKEETLERLNNDNKVTLLE